MTGSSNRGGRIANLFSKNPLIVVSARFDENTRSWLPIADISWEADGQRGSHTIIGPLYNFESWRETEKHMIGLAKAWIDDLPSPS
jgi:hypothetical protein